MFKFFGGHTTNNENNEFDDHLVLDRRQTSWFIGGVILVCTLLFIAGYMIGKRNAMREFSQKIVDDSFEDRAQYALHSLYGAPTAPVEKENDDDAALDALTRETNDGEAAQSSASESSLKKYYAKLIGCGSLATAERFVDRVKKTGVSVKINKRIGKSSRGNGKIVTWFQVVTAPYDNEAELRSAIAPIRRTEKLNNIQIEPYTAS